MDLIYAAWDDCAWAQLFFKKTKAFLQCFVAVGTLCSFEVDSEVCQQILGGRGAIERVPFPRDGRKGDLHSSFQCVILPVILLNEWSGTWILRRCWNLVSSLKELYLKCRNFCQKPKWLLGLGHCPLNRTTSTRPILYLCILHLFFIRLFRYDMHEPSRDVFYKSSQRKNQ